MSAYFVIVAFALIFHFEESWSRRVLDRSLLQRAVQMGWQGVELFTQLFLLFCVLTLSVEVWVPSELFREISLFVFMLAPYAISKLRNQDRNFFLTVFGVGIFILEYSPAASLLERILLAGGMIGTLTFLRVLLKGLEARLFLTQAPRLLRGFPIELLTSAILTLAVSSVIWLGISG